MLNGLGILFLRIVSGFVLIGLALYAMGLLLTIEVADQEIVYDATNVRAIQEVRSIDLNLKSEIRLYRDIDYSEGAQAPWYPKGESPILQRLVNQGELPPVAERIGPEPVVMQGIDGLGAYGGTLGRVEPSTTAVKWAMKGRLTASSLVRWSPGGDPVVPHLAKRWEVDSEYKVWTFFLREGVRWSDGHPFTANDIVFHWEHTKWLGESRPEWSKIGGTIGEVERIDDYTIRFKFEKSHRLLLERLASIYGDDELYTPKHYMELFHLEWGDQALIEKAMQEHGIPTAKGLYLYLRDILNPEHPRMWPWVYRTYQPNPPYFTVRNPYYFAVDPEGNQLPYIDRISYEIKPPNMVPSAAASGAIGLQELYVEYQDYTFYMSQRDAGGYKIHYWLTPRFPVALYPNLERAVEPGKPETKHKSKLLKDKRFRQALSLAIDRQQIIEGEFLGIGRPAQLCVLPQSPYYSHSLATKYAEYDPNGASELLDEMGLTQRDAEGFRTFPDGSRMTWFIVLSNNTDAEEGPMQFVVDNWAEVGIRARVQAKSLPLVRALHNARKTDFKVWAGDSFINPILLPMIFAPVSKVTTTGGIYAKQASLWYNFEGLHGKPIPPEVSGVEPAEGGPLREVLELLNLSEQAVSQEESIALFHKLADIAAENVFAFGFSLPPPKLVIVDKRLANVPRVMLDTTLVKTPSNGGTETFYFEEDHGDSEAVERLVESEIRQITPLPLQGAAASSGDKLSRLIRFLLVALVAVGLILISIRHPFVGRRLVIMVPTLAVVSLIVFTIIQLPPGSFIQVKLDEAAQTGSSENLAIAEQLEELFPFEEDFLTKYALWLGLKWFVTFDARDTGLLQGELGFSMETMRSINEMVGDRIILTLSISIGAILLTWAIALPIGIYSAVRQYSPADYFFTFMGFLGMCVPNFLLALLLLYFSNEILGIKFSGLFSPEFAGEPGWTWAKFVDLLQHIWVPIIVLGVGGTAVMIRIMRANLLDELKKPYVTTARAKGMRPFKMLIKYPVRLALNPFISSIGYLFPQLVSGGAIVALILSLPTVGPLLLNALLSEDTYLAGSMLMVLSILGVFGTLVSDLLLLWLDPRIRYEGGTR